MAFDVITDLSRSIARIDLNRAAKRAVKARAEDIAELNRDQLKKGERADGAILPDYAPASVDKFGKPEGPIKLFDRGEFYGGLKATFSEKDFAVVGTDSKTDILQFGTGEGAHPDGFGEDIVGLTDESIGELAQDSLGQIQYEIRQQL
jgi:hypothetical protein